MSYLSNNEMICDLSREVEQFRTRVAELEKERVNLEQEVEDVHEAWTRATCSIAEDIQPNCRIDIDPGETTEETIGHIAGQVSEVVTQCVDALTTRVAELESALKALLDTHDEDVGMDEYPDDESVGSEQSTDGLVHDMKLTFGILRHARKILNKKDGDK